MSAADKFLLRKPVETVTEPSLPNEVNALRTLVAAGAWSACPAHETGVVAAHLRGPVAAIPSETHPDHRALMGDALRGRTAVNALIREASQAPTDSGSLRCNCAARYEHPLHFFEFRVSQGALCRPHPNTEQWSKWVHEAMSSGDVDRLSWAVEPRVEAVKALADRARVENGGALPDLAIDAAAVLLRSVVGPRRWHVRVGWERFRDWPLSRRWTALADECDQIMQQPFVHDRLLRRLVDGE